MGLGRGEGTVALPMVGEFEGEGGTAFPSWVRVWERGTAPFLIASPPLNGEAGQNGQPVNSHGLIG
jgi:hypothetical protein